MAGEPAPDDPTRPDRSVLASLGGETGLPRIRLRDAETGAEAVLPAARAEARYQEVGEIARGGMGVVVKCRDTDLGRDVAMKLLLDEFLEREDVIERFVEEAQIGSQLQHPGIVPVYDMGVRGERRRFFTMKLIKGRTLSALLAERSGPADDLRRFLAIFERACQTMAYAHARGVIHRDLKPSNIMTGSFGEVLVVDWGLGKVLSEGGVADERRAKRRRADVTVVETLRSGSSGSHSHAGSVLGTPFYMPPEQARGETDGLDERADVFALGAILCEILTGSPPYTGTGIEPLRKAQKADQAEAKERLRESHADPALVELALACMAPSPAARPRNAGAVSAELAEIHARVEERAREAEVEAARSHAEAEAHARERRLTIVLASTVALVVALGAGGYVWSSGNEARRLAALTRSVDDALDVASRAHGAATASGSSSAWIDALTAAKRGVALARADGVHAEDRDRAAALLAAAEKGEGEARVREKEARERAAVRDRLGAVLNSRGILRPDEYTARVEEEFRDLGIDLSQLTVDAAAAAIRTSPFAEDLIGLLEGSVWYGDIDYGSVAPYREVAHAADEDPWRKRLREARDANRWDDVRALADEVDVRTLPVSSIVLLGSAIPTRRERADLYRRAWLDHPENPEIHTALQFAVRDFFTNASFGDPHLRPRQEPERRHAFVSLALHPDSMYARTSFGWSLFYGGDLDAAERVALDAIGRESPAGADPARELLGSVMRTAGRDEEWLAFAEGWTREAPDSCDAQCALARALLANDSPDRAVQAATRATELDAKDPDSWFYLGYALSRKSRVPEAVEAYRQCLLLLPDADAARVYLAWLLVGQDEREEALDVLDAGIRRRPESYWLVYTRHVLSEEPLPAEKLVEGYRETLRRAPDNVYARLSLAWALRTAGDLPGMLEQLREVELRDDSGEVHWYAAYNLLGAGAYPSAITEAEECVRRNPTDDGPTQTLLNTLVHSREWERAKEVAERAVNRNPTNPWFHLYLAQARYFGEFDLRSAEAEAHTASIFAPSAPFVQRVIAWIAQAKGNDDASIRFLERVVGASRPQTDDAAEVVPAARREAWRELARLLIRKRLYARAFERMRDYVDLTRKDPDHEDFELAEAEADLRRVERIAALAPDLIEIRERTFDSEDPADLCAAATMLTQSGDAAGGAAYYARAFERSPELLDAERGVHAKAAVGAAVRAASDTEGLDDGERRALRMLAHGWARHHLATWARSVALGEDPDRARRDLVAVEGWGMADIAEVRAPSRIEALPPDEAALWRDLWRRRRNLRRLCAPLRF